VEGNKGGNYRRPDYLFTFHSTLPNFIAWFTNNDDGESTRVSLGDKGILLLKMNSKQHVNNIIITPIIASSKHEQGSNPIFVSPKSLHNGK
jgi:hypothetical protein